MDQKDINIIHLINILFSVKQEYLEGQIYFRNPAKNSLEEKQAEAIDEEIKQVEG